MYFVYAFYIVRIGEKALNGQKEELPKETDPEEVHVASGSAKQAIVDAVIAGGSDESTPLVASSFQLLYALAEEEVPEPDKLSRPFDAGRTGLV